MMKIALSQCNPIVGDLAGNLALCEADARKAAKAGAQLIVFPEMALTGYPPEDLVLRESFRKKTFTIARKLAKLTKELNLAILVGSLWQEDERISNAALWMQGGKISHILPKCALPNYGVFDEKRLFTPGFAPGVIVYRGLKIGILICEDLWDENCIARLAQQSPHLLIAINASPYETGKAKRRHQLARRVVRKTKAPLVYLNTVGGQDELVFDGCSFVMNVDSKKPVRLPRFEPALALTEWKQGNAGLSCLKGLQAAVLDDSETIYSAMILGLRDYVNKANFPGVVIGLSGGVDSALTAAVAVDALGPKRVKAVFLPSPYTSEESTEDAAKCAKALGIKMDTLSITPAMEVMDDILRPLFRGQKRDTTEENIQARLRGNLLMAISNKTGSMVITTGNKSEMSVGYATLYGDMCGGYSVLKDVYKTTVFKLARWRNRNTAAIGIGPKGRVIPERIITRPPSAELRPNQRDEDSLPPYEILDAILFELIENQTPMPEIVEMGYPLATVRRVSHLLYRSEYKRRQAPPGVKVSGMSFGRDRRYPIINKFTA
jgi:NAD+ synthase